MIERSGALDAILSGTRHPHDYARSNPNRVLERVDIVVFASERADALEESARKLGFCHRSRQLRAKAANLRELASQLLAGDHLDWLDDRRAEGART